MGDVKRYHQTIYGIQDGELILNEHQILDRLNKLTKAQARIADQADDLRAAAEAQRLGLEERDALRTAIKELAEGWEAEWHRSDYHSDENDHGLACFHHAQAIRNALKEPS